jgi:hypothetical protein
MDTRRRDELTTEILSRIIDATAIDRASSTEEFDERRLDLFTILETTLARAIAAYSSSGHEADQTATHLGEKLITYVRGHRLGDERGH